MSDLVRVTRISSDGTVTDFGVLANWHVDSVLEGATPVGPGEWEATDCDGDPVVFRTEPA
jgi:hypothetical protein